MTKPSSFTYNENTFLYNDEPIQLISGAIHYFRVVPEYWKDRLLKLKACGFNTLETYVPWNLHEPKPGVFDFSGILNVVGFIKTAAELGLHVIVRPGPYICAEWEMGGLPAWLLNEPDMKIRCLHRPYLDLVELFFSELLKQLCPLQCTRGGPIIAMQIENEYGAYGNDKEYLRYLENMMRAKGIEVLLFTSDQANDPMLAAGSLPHILKTGNFGSEVVEKLGILRKHQAKGPLMCMEFWNGWFDRWGERHHVRDPQDVANCLDQILKVGGSVNFYMFHGGTNFGYMNGANYGDSYQPTITSYDYDSPLSEAGDITEKYRAISKVISKYKGESGTPIPAPIAKRNYGSIKLDEQISLFDSLDSISTEIERITPEPMEKLGQHYGFILYRTFVTTPFNNASLNILDLHDRAQVFLNGKYLGVFDREKWDTSQGKISITAPPQGATLDILVENMGRPNYGSHILDHKGITHGVRINGQYQFHWTIYCLPLNNLSSLKFQKNNLNKGPLFCRGILKVDQPADTFLTLPNWTKGICFINGFNLGRYWKRGPQRSLYVPAPLLKKGPNELIVFELEETSDWIVEFKDHPSLDHFISR